MASQLDVNLGDIERKVDMSLDDIIKQTKKMDRKIRTDKVTRQKRLGIISMSETGQAQGEELPRMPKRRRKHLNHSGGEDSQFGQDIQKLRDIKRRREVLERFETLQSSTFHQTKVAESRTWINRRSISAATELSTRGSLNNVTAPLNRWRRKPMAQGAVQLAGVGARTAKLLSPNVMINGVNGGIKARPFGKRVSPSPRPNWVSNNGFVSGLMHKPQTLDSRFASLREERQLKRQFGSHLGWRR